MLAEEEELVRGGLSSRGLHDFREEPGTSPQASRGNGHRQAGSIPLTAVETKRGQGRQAIPWSLLPGNNPPSFVFSFPAKRQNYGSLHLAKGNTAIWWV